MYVRVPFILASGSPRRKRLLEELGFAFRVVVSHAKEHVPESVSPAQLVQDLALEKATLVSCDHPEALTLAADTVVVLAGEILGKPTDAAEASRMLKRLSGATHTVFTGIALEHPASQRRVTAVESTRVTFAPLTDEEIAGYVATGSPMDKAGAYGIQEDFGALFVSRIEGDFFTVMGLPLHRLYRTLRERFGDLCSLHAP